MVTRFVAQIASALLVTKEKEEFILISYKYVLKTNKVGIIPSSSTKSLIALTAIYNIIFLLICLFFNLSQIILYICYKVV
jgi:hypothetical protein